MRTTLRLSPREAAREMERDAALLDVFTRRELAGEHVRGAVNVPIHELPSHLGDIPEGRPLLAMCTHGPAV